MSDRNLDIALRIKADVDQAIGKTDALGASIDSAGKKAAGTKAAFAGVGTQLDAMLTAVQTAAQSLQRIEQGLQSNATAGVAAAQVNQQVATTARDAAAAAEKLAESDSQATARIQAMVAASLEQVRAQASATQAATAGSAATQGQAGAADATAAAIGRQNAAMAQSSRLVAAASTATRGQSAELVRLLGQIDPTIVALERLDAQEQKLREFRASGALSADDFAAFRQRINEQRDGIDGASKSMHGFSLNTSMARRELGLLAKDIATGQYGRFEQSFLTLLSNSGALSALLNPVALGIGAVVASVVALGVAANQEYVDQEKLNKAIAQTGNYAGISSASVDALAKEVAGATGSIGEARGEILALAGSGSVGADSLHEMALAGKALADLTGQSAEKAAGEVTRLFDGTAAGAARANDQYHFLTQAQYEQIRALEEQGDKQGAVRLTAEAFYNSIQPRVKAMTPEVTGLAAAWERLSKAVHGVAETQWDKFKEEASLALGTASNDARIRDLQQRKKAGAVDANGNVSSLAGVINNMLGLGFGPREQAELDRLLALKKLQDDLASKTATNQQLEANAVDAATTTDAIEAQFATASEQKQRKINEIINAYNARMAAALAKGDQKLYDELQAKQALEIERASAFYDKKGRTGKSQASIDSEAANARAQLTKGLGDEQGALDPVAKAWANYNDAVTKANELADKAKKSSTANVAAINGVRDAYIASAAQVRDAALQKQADKDRAAFEKLRDSLKDVNGVSLGNVRAQIAELEKLLANKTISGDEYKSTVEAALNQGIKKLPVYQGIDATVGGPFSELDKLDAQQAKLQAAYAADLDLLNQQHEAKLRSDESFIARENQLYQEHARNLQAIDDARVKVMLLGISDSFSQAADAIKQGFGEQSAAYHAAFRLQKAAAIAMAIVNMQLDISQATAKGFPANVPLIAKAIGEGLTILGNIRSASFARGGYTGPGSKYQEAGVVHAEEFVNRREVVAQPGARPFLEDFNRVGMRALAWHLPGYADGGYVSPLSNAPQLPAPAVLRSAANGSSLIVSPVQVVVHASAGSTVESKQSTGSDGSQLLELAINAVANDMATGGKSAQAIERRYNIARKGNSYG